MLSVYLGVSLWAAVLAIYDLRQRRLPNALVLGGAVAAAGYLLIQGRSLLGATPVSAWLAGLAIPLVLLPIHRLGWLGAGDVKLMSAIGLLGGMETLLTTFVVSSFLTLPVALWIQWRRSKAKVPQMRVCMPQGLFLAAGLIASMFAH